MKIAIDAHFIYISYLISFHYLYFQITCSPSIHLMDELPKKTLWRNSAPKKVDVASSPDPSVMILKTDVDSHVLYPALRHRPADLCFYKAELEELQFQLIYIAGQITRHLCCKPWRIQVSREEANKHTNAQRAWMSAHHTKKEMVSLMEAPLGGKTGMLFASYK